MMSMSNMGICGDFQLGCWISKSYVERQVFVTTCFLGSLSNDEKTRPFGRVLKLGGAGDGTRTRDTLLGRQALYH